MNVRPMRPETSFCCALTCVTIVQTASTVAAARCFRDMDPPNGWLVVDYLFLFLPHSCSYSANICCHSFGSGSVFVPRSSDPCFRNGNEAAEGWEAANPQS